MPLTYDIQMAAILRSESLAARSMKLLEDHDTCTSVDMSNYIQAIAQVNSMVTVHVTG